MLEGSGTCSFHPVTLLRSVADYLTSLSDLRAYKVELLRANILCFYCFDSGTLARGKCCSVIVQSFAVSLSSSMLQTVLLALLSILKLLSVATRSRLRLIID